MNFDWRKIGLGTAQWGMDYGISSSSGKTDSTEVSNILSFARKTGIKLIDTASLYGDAESVLGRQKIDHFLLVTKTPQFAQSEIYSKDVDKMLKDFNNSLSLLKLDNIYGLLIHHADDLLAPGGELLTDALMSLRDRGLVKKIGVSIYDPDIIEILSKRIDLDIVQLPLNVFDQRAIHNGSLDLLDELGVEVHARSAFLQGLLLMPLSDVHQYFFKWYDLLSAWHKRCGLHGITPLQSSLGFVLGQNAVDYCVVGFERLEQLEDVYASSSSSSSSSSSLINQFDYSNFFIEDDGLINPRNWNFSE
jgi:aryl-alcohol dehydrogenase-like predicted oxidoreductase